MCVCVSSGDVRAVCWTPPASTEGSTPTWTEGTPSFTESSSSGDQGLKRTLKTEAESNVSTVENITVVFTGCLSTPVKRHDGRGKKVDMHTDPGVDLAINCLTTEMVGTSHHTAHFTVI